MNSMIRTNPDGSPVVSIRKIRGRTVLMAHIRKGEQWVEVPAENIVAMVGKKSAPPTFATTPETAKQLREITDRYALGTAR
jgi:hypothetical protein